MSSLTLVVMLAIGGPVVNHHDHIAAGTVMVASHYGHGDGFDGRRMANGEVFRANDPSIVAHKHLPFGTKLLLKNPVTGASQKAVVKDRGPFIKGRDLDVSAAGAKKLGFLENGVTRLEVVILD